MSPPRLPLEPLEAAVGPMTLRHRSAHEPRRHDAGSAEVDHPGGVHPRIAELAGVSRRTVVRWRHIGIPLELADRAACALGLHPANVWGDQWWRVSR